MIHDGQVTEGIREMWKFTTATSLVAVAVLGSILGDVSPSNAQMKHYLYVLVTGQVADKNSVIVSNVCRLVNKNTLNKNTQVRCAVVSTLNPSFILLSFHRDEVDLGLVHFERAIEAYKGIKKYQQGGPDKDLRSLFAFYPEPLLLVSSAKVADDVVYAVVKAVLQNIEELKGRVPRLMLLEVSEMVERAKVIPLHDGAIRYYRENGLM